MSLAMFAAPFDDDNNDSSNMNSDNNIMNKKRRAHRRTQKMYPKENFDTNKVNSVLDKIYSNLDEDDDDKDAFSPPPKPESMGVQKAAIENQTKEPLTNMSSNNDVMFRTLGRAPQPNYENTDNLDLNDYSNYGDNKSNEEYYKRVIPGYNPANKPHYNRVNYSMPE